MPIKSQLIRTKEQKKLLLSLFGKRCTDKNTDKEPTYPYEGAEKGFCLLFLARGVRIRMLIKSQLIRTKEQKKAFVVSFAK